jgi:ABC-type sugar transport system ATPase subunit
LEGRRLNEVPPGDRDVALAFQIPALYPHLTAADNLALGLRVRGLPETEIRQRVREVAEVLELEACLERLPGQLSGGESQRVALGKALARRPRLVLLDEPLSNLDAPMRFSLRLLIARIQRHFGLTMVYVTHDQAEAMVLGHRVAVLRQGVLQQVATPGDLYRTPANTFVAQFFGSPPMNLLAGTLRSAPSAFALSSPEVQVPLTGADPALMAAFAGRPVLLGFRPEALVPSESASSEPTLPLTVEFVHHLGPETHVCFQLGPHRLLARMNSGAFARRSGEQVRVRFNAREAVFFDPQTGLRL